MNGRNYDDSRNYFSDYERRHPDSPARRFHAVSDTMTALFGPHWVSSGDPHEHVCGTMFERAERGGTGVYGEASHVEEPVLVPNMRARRRRRRRKKKKKLQLATLELAEGENNEQDAGETAPVAEVNPQVSRLPDSPGHTLIGSFSEGEEETQDSASDSSRLAFNHVDPEELEELNDRVEKIMETPLALMALEAGLEVEEVRLALMERLSSHGAPFESSDDLVMYVLGGEEEEEEEGECESEDYEEAVDDVDSSSETLMGLNRFVHPRTPNNTPTRNVSTSAGQRYDGHPGQLPQRYDTTLQPSPEVPFLSTFRSPSSQSPQIPLTRPAMASYRRIGAVAVQTPRIKLPTAPGTSQRGGIPPAQPSPTNTTKENADSKLCSVCFEKEVKTVFLPCKHIACCTQCASKLSQCPICRCAIKHKMDVYFP